ncbi:MAG: right-handed parallel beta-helix repeat-containing protein [Cyanobacteria bacterium P01_G01_bin.19]
MTLATASFWWSIASFSQIKSNNSSIVVSNVTQLVRAVNQGKDGDLVTIKAGTYELQAPLMPKSGMSILGEGEKTIITAASTWQPSTEKLPKIEDPAAYLFSLEKVPNVTLSQMKLTANRLHGAIYADNADGLEISQLQIRDFLWSGIRTFRMDNFQVRDSVFIDAGGRYGPVTGAALYMNWTKNSQFCHNRIFRSENSTHNSFGFKGIKGTNLHFHHNDVRVNFSLEFPFENDRNIELDRNIFAGTVSIPKYKGGLVLEDELAYHIHHNWFQKSYALEWARNAVEVDHNLFDFEPTDDDRGNLITNHGAKSAPGFTLFHDNYIKNPGRGIFWSKGIYNGFHFYNNHVKANTLTRSDGLFSFNPQSDFKTIEIKNNIIENTADNPRPLMRDPESYAAIIENNTLINISDTSAYKNSQTGEPHGLLKPLSFEVGAYGEYTINNWNAIKMSNKKLIGGFYVLPDIALADASRKAFYQLAIHLLEKPSNSISMNWDSQTRLDRCS